MRKSESEIGSGTLPVRVGESGRIELIDQRLLPEECVYFDATTLEDMCMAIKTMVVRGAPSIGVAAAFGMASEALRLVADCSSSSEFLDRLKSTKEKLDSTRPTAVNLMWATDQMLGHAQLLSSADNDCALSTVAEGLMDFAKEMLEEHIRINRTLSEFGAEVIKNGAKIVTHCNAGSLAACGWGTALGVIRSAYLNGREPHVYVDETRPRNQGSKLTMWELMQDSIPATLVCDSMSGHLMSRGEVDVVIVGADRIAANGDTANKIGTYNLAVLAHYHKVPFYVAAPLSTFDIGIESGKEIPIEFRDQEEITTVNGSRITVSGAEALNPAFDVTPAELIAGIITEAGVLRPDYRVSIARAFDTKIAAG